MYLLNERLISEYVSKPTGVYLDIHGFDVGFLHSTYYYFRLGHHFKLKGENSGEWKTGELSEKNRSLTLGPHGYALVKSLERFYLSEKVMAIFGPISDFAAWGLELVHSPFLDPLFDGHLDLGIWNRMTESTEIQLGQPIGKIKFFDISDTYPVRDVRGTLSEGKFEKRKEFRDDDPVQPWVDSYEPYKYDWRRR